MLSKTSIARLGIVSTTVIATFGCGHDKTSGPKALTPASVTAQTSTTIAAVVGTALSTAPAVRVLSEDGQPVADANVTFTLSAGSGAIANTSTRTGVDGVASAGQWTLGTKTGQQRLTATVAALPAVEFIATASPDVPASISPNGSAVLNGTVGAPVPTIPAAVVKDQYGNPVPGVAVTFAVTQGGGSLAGANATSDAAGVARPTSWTLGSAIGTNTVTASVTGIATPATFTATAAAGPAAALSFVAGTGQTATVNTAVTISPAVRVTDSFGNPVGGLTVSFAPATGSVTALNAVTAADGVATAGTWTLGKTAGTNSLTAQYAGLSATLTAVGVAGPASKLVAAATMPASLPVATDVAPKPSVRVTDDYANAGAGATVIFAVRSGAGVVTTATATSDATGIATVGSWTVGTQAGVQTLRATLGSTTTTLDFDVNVVAGPPAQMRLLAGGNQYGRVGSVLPVSPSVSVVDTYGNLVSGASVTFTPMGASGSLTGATVATFGGVATLGSWTLGSAEGVDSVYATVGALPPLPIYARVVPISQFNITLRFLTPATVTQQAAFQRAAERWRDVVIGDLTDIPASVPANFCGQNEPALNETIDDVLIYVSLDSIDGSGKVLGSAGPCATRTANDLPVLGFMHFDTADLAQLEADNQLDDVIRHEMGHVLGIGPIWPDFSLVSSAGTSDPFYIGPSGRQGFSLVGGGSYLGNPVPVENTGGAGTADSHWRESVLRTELMTGYASAPGGRMPLSLVTIGSLEDLGYTISAWGYDVFTFGVDLRAGAATAARQLRELPPQRPLVQIDQSGRVRSRVGATARVTAATSRLEVVRKAPSQPDSVRRRN